MKGHYCYISGRYIKAVRASCHLRPEQPHEMDAHHGLHYILGQHDGEVEVAPVRGTELVIRVPEYAVWTLGA